MATRCRWFHIGLPCSFDQLGVRLQGYIFSEGIDCGFSIDRIAPTHISGNLICRNRLKILQAQSDGSPTEVEVTTISLQPFVIFAKAEKYWLRVSDPPRSTRDLTNALERAIGMGFFVETVIFSHEAFKSILKNVDDCRLVSTKGIAALHESNTLARIELVCKDGVILETMSLLKGLAYVVDTAAYEISYRRERGQLSFSKSGLVRINGRLSEHIIELIEETLR